jgi:hypothetical protein
VAYSPNAYYTGADSFEVQVTDGYGNSDVITVSVAVGAVNAPGRAVFVFE